MKHTLQTELEHIDNAGMYTTIMAAFNGNIIFHIKYIIIIKTSTEDEKK